MATSVECIQRAKAILDRIPMTPFIGAEIGVAGGKLSAILLRRRQLLTLFMVDLWGHNPSLDYAATGDHYATETPVYWRNMIHKARVNTARFKSRRNMIQRDSVFASKMLPDAYLDFAFIDDDHSFSGCSRSIEAWWPKVKSGGWLGGHDYKHTDPAYKFGVTEAVHTYFNPLHLSVETGENFTWFVRVL